MRAQLHAIVFWGMLYTFAAGNPARAQDATRVQMSAKAADDEVPLNRTVVYLVELKWSGALSQIEFDPPETPQLSNFKLAGSSSSNWAGVESGINTASKTFEYTLKPQELGMGYVERMRVSYLDRATNERHSLYTDRLGVQVIDPVREPEDAPVGLAMLLGLAATILLGFGVLRWQARQNKRAREQLAQQAQKSPEEEFLEQLRAAVDFNSPETKSGFAEVSRLLRHYLQHRFDIPVQGIATAEVVAAYRARDHELSRSMLLEEILQACDVAKFSGGSGDPAQLARVQALAESFLRGHLAPPVNAQS